MSQAEGWRRGREPPPPLWSSEWLLVRSVRALSRFGRFRSVVHRHSVQAVFRELRPLRMADIL